MPEIDGMEACRRIKAVEALRDIPTHRETARSQQEVLRVAFDASATDYIETVQGSGLLARGLKRRVKLKKEIDARKNWEQELTKTISEIGRLPSTEIDQLCGNSIQFCPACKKPLADQTSRVRSRNLYSDPLQCQSSITTVCSTCSTRKGGARIVQNRGARRASSPYAHSPSAG